MWKDPLFWFSQPSVFLSRYDHYFFWACAGLTVVGLLLKILSSFNPNPVMAKLGSRFANPMLTMGIIGLVWFGLRYEDAAILADRYLSGVIVLAFLIWIIFSLKFLLINFPKERAEFKRQQINSRYIPGRQK